MINSQHVAPRPQGARPAHPKLVDSAVIMRGAFNVLTVVVEDIGLPDNEPFQYEIAGQHLRVRSPSADLQIGPLPDTDAAEIDARSTILLADINSQTDDIPHVVRAIRMPLPAAA